MQTRKKEKYIIIGIFIIIAIFGITIVSKNSPLYVFNDWVDANAFFTVGKSWMNGIIPYKDLFEQKGPILYIIYGIGYLFSNNSFLGIYFLEIISFTFFLYYCYKIGVFVLEKKYAFLAAILAGTIIISSHFFVQGGSAEEFILPLLAFSTYQFLKYNQKGIFDKKCLMLNGFVAGMIALIKFNVLGFWFIWMALLFFKAIYEKKYKESLISCLYFLAGMLFPILLTIGYFLIVGGLKEFIDTYIIFNISSYSNANSMFSKIKTAIINCAYQLSLNKYILHFTIFGGIGILFFKDFIENFWNKIFILLSFPFLALGVYYGGVPYIYYFLLNSFFTLFGILFLIYFINHHYLLKKEKTKKNVFLLFVIITIITVPFFLKKSINSGSRDLTKENFAQFEFLEVINKKNNPTLLNYDFLDGGFYTTSNIVPNIKYFMRQNVDSRSFPVIMEEQNKAMEEKLVDFVVIREYGEYIGYRNDIKPLNDNYECVAFKEQPYEGIIAFYYLYQKKEN